MKTTLDAESGAARGVRIRPMAARTTEVSRLLKARNDGTLWRWNQEKGRRERVWGPGRGMHVLVSGSGPRRRVHVGELFLETWGHPKPPGKALCFVDGDRTNVDVTNIYWGEPDVDARRSGRKLRARDVVRARQMYRDGSSIAEVAETLDVTHSTARDVITGEVVWREIPGACRLRRSPQARRMSEADVVRARQMYRDGASCVQVGDALGVAATSAQRAINGETHAEVAGACRMRQRHRGKALDARKVRLIRKLHARGQTQVDIAGRVGCTQATVSQVLAGRTWAHVK